MKHNILILLIFAMLGSVFVPPHANASVCKASIENEPTSCLVSFDTTVHAASNTDQNQENHGKDTQHHCHLGQCLFALVAEIDTQLTIPMNHFAFTPNNDQNKTQSLILSHSRPPWI